MLIRKICAKGRTLWNWFFKWASERYQFQVWGSKLVPWRERLSNKYFFFFEGDGCDICVGLNARYEPDCHKHPASKYVQWRHLRFSVLDSVRLLLLQCFWEQGRCDIAAPVGGFLLPVVEGHGCVRDEWVRGWWWLELTVRPWLHLTCGAVPSCGAWQKLTNAHVAWAGSLLIYRLTRNQSFLYLFFMYDSEYGGGG